MSSGPTSQIEPAFTDNTQDFHQEKLEIVVLWCTAGDPVHWMSSFTFKQVTIGYEGVSADMRRPLRHEATPDLPEYETVYGSLTISPRKANMLVSSRTPKRIEIALIKTVTVNNVVELITKKKLHQYKFSEKNSGCMCWQIVLLNHFVREGWISQSSVDKVHTEIEALKKSLGENRVPYPPVEGTFY